MAVRQGPKSGVPLAISSGGSLELVAALVGRLRFSMVCSSSEFTSPYLLRYLFFHTPSFAPSASLTSYPAKVTRNQLHTTTPMDRINQHRFEEADSRQI